jgi:two-component system phosphate regulon response regulator PhoB
VKKILIVDDDANIVRLVRMSLEEEGYELREAQDGERALQAAKQIRPDLVVLDLMLPDKWGYAVCEEIKKDPDTQNALILILTARGSSPSRARGGLKGADDYMVKPFQPRALREKIKKLLDRGGASAGS